MLRKDYLNQLKRILKDDGILFLKVMSIEEKGLPDDEGPYRFSKQEILDTFENNFEVKEIKSTVYYGTLDPLPKALFVVIKQK
jgi:cyclopropane fatty-acyl-phospholipid synthase-like methyltransferase